MKALFPLPRRLRSISRVTDRCHGRLLLMAISTGDICAWFRMQRLRDTSLWISEIESMGLRRDTQSALLERIRTQDQWQDPSSSCARRLQMTSSPVTDVSDMAKNWESKLTLTFSERDCNLQVPHTLLPYVLPCQDAKSATWTHPSQMPTESGWLIMLTQQSDLKCKESQLKLETPFFLDTWQLASTLEPTTPTRLKTILEAKMKCIVKTTLHSTSLKTLLLNKTEDWLLMCPPNSSAQRTSFTFRPLPITLTVAPLRTFPSLRSAIASRNSELKSLTDASLAWKPSLESSKQWTSEVIAVWMSMTSDGVC